MYDHISIILAVVVHQSCNFHCTLGIPGLNSVDLAALLNPVYNNRLITRIKGLRNQAVPEDI